MIAYLALLFNSLKITVNFCGISELLGKYSSSILRVHQMALGPANNNL